MTTSPDIPAARRSDRGNPRSGGEVPARFPELLRRKKKSGEVPATVVAAAVPLFERSLPARVTRPAEPNGGLAAVSRVVDRILIGASPAGAEARIRIGSGSLAGAEIRVCSVAGDISVQAQLLTVSAGSRQTLAMAIERIARRLQARKLGESHAGPVNPRGIDAGGRGADSGGENRRR